MASDYEKTFEELVDLVLKEEASDLHLSEGRQPYIRLAGSLVPLVKYPGLSKGDIKNVIDKLLDEQKKDNFLNQKEVDFSYDHRGTARFRGNAYFQLGKISVALRLVPKKINY